MQRKLLWRLKEWDKYDPEEGAEEAKGLTVAEKKKICINVFEALVDQFSGEEKDEDGAVGRALVVGRRLAVA